MKKEKLFVPALRGIFGDWVYYSCLMPMQIVAEKIDFAKELHKSTNLSDLIQREIKVGRGVDIAKYLSREPERFFNSLVVAVYGGEPIWYEVGLTPNEKFSDLDELPDFALHSFGILSLSGDEKLFAIDGQHRLAGIKKAIKDGGELNDEVSIVLVAHINSKEGLQRTRRLFTTLNKTAVPVSKGEKIALDENDVMAIVARRLVEDNPKFGNDRIAYKATNNLSPSDDASLTTIGNLYDLLNILFAKILKDKKVSQQDLKFIRPDEQKLDEYYQSACLFFDTLEMYLPELQEFFESKNPKTVVAKYRGTFGGSLVFRPVGLTLFFEVVEQLAKYSPLEDAIADAAKLPRDLSDVPYRNILWDIKTQNILTKRKVLTRNLMLYMLNKAELTPKYRKLYADVLGQDGKDLVLPPRVS